MNELPSRAPDCEAIVTLLSTEAGGRSRPAFTGYRPNHPILPDYITSGTHEYLDADSISPGQSGRARIWFLTPDVYPHSLWVGRVINVQEGGRVVGRAEITAVLNPVLLGDSE